MARPAVSQGRLSALRREIARIEGTLPERLAVPGENRAVAGRHSRPEMEKFAYLKTGAWRFDAALGGGLPAAALTEITSRETRDGGIVAGFALALAAIAARKENSGEGRRPVFWVSTSHMLAEAGLPYALGLERFFGFAPDQLLLARTVRLEDALWATEEAAKTGGFSAIFLELRGNPTKLDLTASRRLHNRASRAGQPIFLIRHSAKAEATAAITRIFVTAAPTALRETLVGRLPRSLGPPAFALNLIKSRTGRIGDFVLEWNPHDFAFRERNALAVRPVRQSGGRKQDSGGLAAASFDRSAFATQAWSGVEAGRKGGKAS
ncbi:hypothetical protein [Chelativorans sp. Marseille-P2723]|uniref:ImuA family protein n=1 Tax=Chelativorans sp. Marseille-P2723 TaxID=2709133 RepID=UPI001FEEA2EC|nr:hypothetical protein [Chelativorans sp. Marseille-P2723]